MEPLDCEVYINSKALRRSIMRRNKYDLIRDEYVQGCFDSMGNRITPSLKQLSKKYSIPLSTIFRRSSKEKWKDQKNEFLESLRAKNDESAAERITDSIVSINSFKTDLAELLITRTKKILLSEEYVSPGGIHALSLACLNVDKLTCNIKYKETKDDDFQAIMSLLDEIAERKISKT